MPTGPGSTRTSTRSHCPRTGCRTGGARRRCAPPPSRSPEPSGERAHEGEDVVRVRAGAAEGGAGRGRSLTGDGAQVEGGAPDDGDGIVVGTEGPGGAVGRLEFEGDGSAHRTAALGER